LVRFGRGVVLLIIGLVSFSPSIFHGAAAQTLVGAATGNRPALTWARSYSQAAGWCCVGGASTVHQTSDGGYIVGGASYTSQSTSSIAQVLKLDRVGEIQWQRVYGPGWIVSIQQTQHGGYIAADGTGVGTSILRLDLMGNIVWQRFYNASVSAIEESSDGGYVVSGAIVSFAYGYEVSSGAWIARLDSAGDILWQRLVEDEGPAFDSFNSVSQTRDGGFAVAGFTYPSSGIVAHLWVMKFDSGGSLLWQNVYTGGGITGAFSIQQTSDGGFIVGGFTEEIYLLAAWLLKLDSSGGIVWQKAFAVGDSSRAYSEFYSVQQTSDGGYVATGEGPTEVIVVRTDGFGNLVWEKGLGEGSRAVVGYSVDQTRDGGFIVAGQTISCCGYVWLVKLDANGDCCARINVPINSPVIDTSDSQIATYFSARDANVAVTYASEVAMPANAMVLTQCYPRITH